MSRFVLIENNSEYPADERTRWYFDTERRLLPDAGQEFNAVQVYADRDPNTFVRHEKLYLIYTDQAEYYCVCGKCYNNFAHMQWSGGTRGEPDWREKSHRFLANHLKQKGWCEFCAPVFGNGGWSQ